jgi:hypothetical protein
MAILDSIIGLRCQDETGAKYTVKGYKQLHQVYIILETSMGNEILVNLERYDDMIQLGNDTRTWEDYAKVPYTISAFRN